MGNSVKGYIGAMYSNVLGNFENCFSKHMPKRVIKTISHFSLGKEVQSKSGQSLNEIQADMTIWTLP